MSAQSKTFEKRTADLDHLECILAAFSTSCDCPAHRWISRPGRSHQAVLTQRVHRSPLFMNVWYLYSTFHPLRRLSKAAKLYDHRSTCRRVLSTNCWALAAGLRRRRIGFVRTLEPVPSPCGLLACLRLGCRIYIWNVCEHSDKLIIRLSRMVVRLGMLFEALDTAWRLIHTASRPMA